MSGFKHGHDYERFASGIERRYRYRIDAEAEEFLATVLETARRRISVLAKGTRVWRAQLGASEPTVDDQPDGSLVIDYRPYPPERMKPLANAAMEGRVNPKGIPVLYAATSEETAMSEVRPNLASDISLAELEIQRDVSLVDCSIASGPSIYSRWGTEVPADEREEVVWHSINEAFTKPVDLSDRLADYAPTQVIAECFRREGFDGLRYRSGYNQSGDNLALFSVDDAAISIVKLMRMHSVKFAFREWP